MRRKSTESVKTKRGQSHVPRTSDQSRTSDRARTPIRHPIPDREATPDRGEAHVFQALLSSPLDCQMVEPFPPPPSRAASTKDSRTASGGQNSEHHTGSDPSPIQSVWRGSTVSGTPGSRTPRAERAGDLEDKIAPSPNTRRMLTRLQKASPEGGSSAVNGMTAIRRRERLRRNPAPLSLGR